MRSRRRAAMGWWQLLPIDMALAALAITVMSAYALSALPKCADKTRLAEAFVGITTLQLAAVEEFAMTGEFDGTESQVEPTGGFHSRRTGQFSYQKIRSNVVVSGTLPEPQRQVTLTFHAAVIAQGAPYYVLWLCGNRRPPPGWIEPDPAGSAELPPDLMPSVCRDSGIGR